MKRFILATTVTAIAIGAAVAVPVLADGSHNFGNGSNAPWMQGSAQRGPGSMMGGDASMMQMARMMQGAGNGWMGGGAMAPDAMNGFGALDGAFDTDGDGNVTPEEIRAGRLGSIETYDADGNGALSLAEFEALRAARIQELTEGRFQALDADGNGQITAEEFASPPFGRNG